MAVREGENPRRVRAIVRNDGYRQRRPKGQVLGGPAPRTIVSALGKRLRTSLFPPKSLKNSQKSSKHRITQQKNRKTPAVSREFTKSGPYSLHIRI